ncbi:conserved hypothetical protein [Frankia canadensis]|uniref:DUF5709 domain-containing protein n=1 Tax=Frankia canadensis TaxID=1836972 RepID=A0A2I2KNW8_9ACTN|nr:hypothetical protein [Frankia canadensis]SNQ47350.1 conserved hypothetical protein [Frankia canadensis]SOU54640.1 conserved hypothetical protein [Frankia canadensis]
MTQPAPDPGSWANEDAPLESTEMLDSDDLGSTDAGRDPLDDSWDAPDRPSSATRYPNTPREERQGASFDRLLSAELPDADPYAEAERRESGAVLDADAYGVGSTGLMADDQTDGEVSALVEPDRVAGEDGGLYARETRRARGRGREDDGWSPTAEESALHLD